MNYISILLCCYQGDERSDIGGMGVEEQSEEVLLKEREVLARERKEVRKLIEDKFDSILHLACVISASQVCSIRYYYAYICTCVCMIEDKFDCILHLACVISASQVRYVNIAIHFIYE
jgi:hypothetical protein